MKKIISSGVAIILALGFALAQQEFNLDLSKTYSEKKIVEKIIHHLKKNKSLVALDQDFQTFLKSQYSAQFEEERISGPEATLAFLEKKNADLADIINQEKKDEFSPKFANSANVEMFSDGISKGSLRLLKIRIGEPGLFNLKRISIPVYIYLAGRGNSFSSSNEDEKNKLTYADLLDPLGGVINFSVADKLQFIESKLGLTHVSLSYQICAKLTNGEVLQTDNNKAFLSGFYSAGVLLDTGAWEEEAGDNMGIFWLHIRHIGSLLSKSLNAKLFNENLKTWVPGVSVESGLFINKTINFKVGFYKYFATPDQPEFQYLKDWKIKFSLDFTAKQELQKESGR